MKPLESDIITDFRHLDEAVRDFKLDEGDELEGEFLRDALTSGGIDIRCFKPVEKKASVFAVDASTCLRKLRYKAIFASHTIVTRAVFDLERHPDMISGNGSIPYGNLNYESFVDLRQLRPYSDLAARANALRIGAEYGRLLESLSKSGERPDFVLVDGSVHTSIRNLMIKGDIPESDLALDNVKKAVSEHNIVGVVEDTHACDISSRLGFDFTNGMLFDVALNPGEYVRVGGDGISVCYVRLPGKKLPHEQEGFRGGFTVRWEFKAGQEIDGIERLSGMWLCEDDILHSQLYPVRVADHMTRRLKASGIIDEALKDRYWVGQFRDLRCG
jgi:hypothetical protein